MSDRKLMRYVLYRVDPSWRMLPPEEKALHAKELTDLFSGPLPAEVHTYSTVGLRADTDMCLWEISDGAEGIQDLQSLINGTRLGQALIPAYSYLAMTRPSMYTKEHKHEGQESSAAPGPAGATYLFVYPMVKVRPWYRLAFEERRRIMGEHFRVGHKYPDIKIHTGYSFGIDDQEFVVAFEGESVERFLDLVMELRESESSSYTERDVPIFTCVKTPISRIIEQIGGITA